MSVSFTGRRFLVLETIAPAWLACGHVDTVCVWQVAAVAVLSRKSFISSMLRSVSYSPVWRGKWQVTADTVCRVKREVSFFRRLWSRFPMVAEENHQWISTRVLPRLSVNGLLGREFEDKESIQCRRLAYGVP